MGLFGTSKKKMVDAGPEGSAADRLQYYMEQAGAAEERKPKAKAKARRHPPEPPPPDLPRDDAGPGPGGRKGGDVFDAEYHPLAKTPPPRREDPVMDLESRDPDDDHHHHPRSFGSKMFGIPWSGYLQLALACIAVGAIFQAGGLNPFEPGFSWDSALDAAGKGAVTVVSWAFGNGWQPFLVGVLVVAPIWLAWRLLTIPFRH